MRRPALAAALLMFAVAPAHGQVAAPRDPVVVSEARTANNAGVYIAIEEGFFAQEGLNVRLLPWAATGEVILALVAGDMDVTLNAPSVALMQAIARGAALRIVADKGHAGPGDRSQTLMVRQDFVDAGRFRRLKDLKGLKIAESSKGTLPELMIAQILRSRAFLTDNDVVRVPVPYALAHAALTGRAVDAAVIPEPAVTTLEQQRVARAVVTLHDVLPRAQVATVIYGVNLVVRRRDVGERFMRAYLRGVRAFQRGKTSRNIEIIAKYTGQEERMIRLMAWPQVHADGRVNVESLLQLQSWWVREGLLERVVHPAEFLDTAFAEAGIPTR